MGFSARSALVLASVLALVLAPGAALAQGQPGPAPAPAPGGGATPAPAPAAGGGGAAPAGSAAAPADKPGQSSNLGGFSFNDKPQKRAASAGPRAAVRHVSGPIATLPGFEQTGDGGSRFFVQLTQQVPVEERKAQGSITYVLKGAHVNKHNNTNALVTVHFNTPVTRARLVPHGNDLLFILDLRAGVTPTYKMTDAPDKTAMLTVDFAKGDFVTGPAEAPTPAGDQPSPSGEENGEQAAPKPAPRRAGKKKGGAPPPPGPKP